MKNHIWYPNKVLTNTSGSVPARINHSRQFLSENLRFTTDAGSHQPPSWRDGPTDPRVVVCVIVPQVEERHADRHDSGNRQSL